MTPRFTREQATRIAAACEKETALRLSLWCESRFATATHLADVKAACTAVIDDLDGHEGFEDAHEELQDALDAVDCHPLWEASAEPRSHRQSTFGMGAAA